MKDHGKLYVTLWVASGLVCFIAMCLEFFAPSPIKEWSGGYVLVFIASMIVFRAVQTIANDDLATSALPYIAATFLVVVPVAFLAPLPVARIAWYVYFAIVLVAGFYWMVKIVISSFKSEFLKK